MKLFFAEWKKILKRKSVILAFTAVMAAVPLLSLLLLGVSPEKAVLPEPKLNDEDRAAMQRLFENAIEKKEALQARYDAGERGADLMRAIEQTNLDRAFFEGALAWDLPVWDYPYLSDLLYDWAFLTLRLENEALDDKAPLEREREELKALLQKKDYAAYLEYENSRILADEKLSEEEKEAKIRKNTLLLRCDPAGAGAPSAVLSAFSEEERLRKSLETGIDFYLDTTGNTPLSGERRAETESYLTLVSTKLENALIDTSYFGERTLLILSFGTEFAVLILALCLVKALFREELEEKSVALLFSAPFSKRKIFWTKFLLLFLGIAAAFCLAYAEIALSMVLRFPESAKGFAVLSGKEAHILPFALYLFFFLAVRFLPLLFLCFLSLFFAVWIPKRPLGAPFAFILFLLAPLLETLFAAEPAVKRFFLWLPSVHFSLSAALFPTTLEDLRQPALPSLLFLFGFGCVFLTGSALLFRKKNYFKD